MSLFSKSKSDPDKAIIHIDGDAFFASCEVAVNERLRGLPVVTGQEKGMAIAVSYEAKAKGISRGMLMGDIRKLVPETIILPGNYDLYKIYCRRMYNIVKRHALVVEEYSIDECFGDLSGIIVPVSYIGTRFEYLTEIAHKIKDDLERDLGMTFSLGLAPTKTLAKVASKWVKPSGFTAMKQEDIHAFLEKVPVGAVWGIGRSMSVYFQKRNIKTALEFAQKDQRWVEENCAKPYQELWYELNGIVMHRVHAGNYEKHKSIRATRTFRPATNNKSYILSELSKNAEKACLKLRRHDLQFKHLYFFLKTQSFRYKGKEIRFDAPVTTPAEIMNAIGKYINAVHEKDTDYRATGIVLNNISPKEIQQPDLFNMQVSLNNWAMLYTHVDKIFEKFGRNSIFISSSLKARLKSILIDRSKNKQENFYDLALKLGIPSWGDTY